jgi:hypothetical protein
MNGIYQQISKCLGHHIPNVKLEDKITQQLCKGKPKDLIKVYNYFHYL